MIGQSTNRFNQFGMVKGMDQISPFRQRPISDVVDAMRRYGLNPNQPSEQMKQQMQRMALMRALGGS